MLEKQESELEKKKQAFNYLKLPAELQQSILNARTARHSAAVVPARSAARSDVPGSSYKNILGNS
jgi:hypothetical protein